MSELQKRLQIRRRNLPMSFGDMRISPFENQFQSVSLFFRNSLKSGLELSGPFLFAVLKAQQAAFITQNNIYISTMYCKNYKLRTKLVIRVIQ